MDIDRVSYFHVFAETGSLVRACEVIGISQPALSKALKVLELEVGLKLLEPDGRGIRLTAAGQVFRHETKNLLEQWHQVADKVRQKETVDPTRIGTFEVFSTYFLHILSKTVDLKALEIHEFGPGKLEEALLSHKVDLGITYLPIPKAGLDLVEVTRIQMGVYGTKLWSHKKITDCPFVVPISPIETTPTKVTGLDGWPDHKIPRKISYRVTLMESALELCRQGQCIAYLPAFIVKVHNKLVRPEFQLIELPCPLSSKERSQGVYLIQRSQSSEPKLHRQVARALRELQHYQ